MRIFFDTEFSGLTSDPRLLSIGMVADDGRELYIEITNGWTDAMCSPWVREHVMPMLGNGERLTRLESGRRISCWLSSFDTQPTMLGDTDWDTTLVSQLLEECGIVRGSYRLEQLAFSSKEQASSFEVAKQRYFEIQQVIPHHALTDAHAFQAAWSCVFGEKGAPETAGTYREVHSG